MTHFGSSCQISEVLVKRIKLLEEEKKGMSDEEWEEYKEERVKSYEQENSFKMARLQVARVVRAQKAKAKIQAKVKGLMKPFH